MTKSPNPDWKPGDSIKTPFTELTTLNPSEMDVGAIYRSMVEFIVPRPIAFVSTISSDGVVNLAPFSYYNGVSSKPPVLMISVATNLNGSKKDTLKNIEETGGFVVNSANEWLAEPLHQTSALYPEGVSEFNEVGLTEIASESVRAPRVKEAAAQIECTTYKIIPVGTEGELGAVHLVLGEMQRIHIAREAFKDGQIDLSVYKPISKLGGPSYGRTSGVFDLPRAKV